MRIFRAFCVLSALCLLVLLPSRAQEDPNFEVGLKPFGSYNMGNIDSIGLGNGSLTIHIPLISYPQRGGKLKLDFSLYGASVGAYADEQCYPPPISQCYVMPYTTGPIGVNVMSSDALTVMQVQGQQSQYLLELIDATGASHFLGVTGTNLMESVDATGWQGKGNPTSGLTTATASDGTVYYSSSCTGCVTDANGNQIKCTSGCSSPGIPGAYTDTLGRVIPQSTVTTNYTNCTGSLPVGTAYIWNPPGVSGGTYSLKFCYVGNTPGFDGLLESVVLPNNTAWTFTYALGTTNIYPGLIGDNFTPFQLPFLTQITFPTGGTIGYTSGIIPTRCVTHQWVDDIGIISRTLNPNDGVTPASTWTYTYAGGGQPGGGANPTTVVSAPPSSGTVPDDSVHTFGYGGCTLYETQAQSYQGSHTSGTLLKTVNTTYSYTNLGWVPWLEGNVVVTNVQTAWANGQSDSISYTYDSGFQFQNGTGYIAGTFGKQTAKKEYDYGGTLLRTTNMNYLALTNSTYKSANIIDPVSSVQITDGGGTQRGYTTYGYDAAGGVHGNLTSTSRWLNTTSTYLTTNNVYDSYGRVTSTTDPKNNTTTYGYTPSSCPSGSGYAGSGPNSVENPLLQTTYNCYDVNTGLPTQTTDPNGLATGTTYDQMLRTLAINNPDGGQATFCYTDTGSESGGGTCSQSSPPYEVVISEKINSSTNRASTLEVDGVGREIRQAVTNGETKPYDEMDTCYDGNGRVSFKSYPFQDYGPFATARTCASPEAGDSFAYEGLGRATKVTHSDGGFISTSYSGNSTTVTDEAGRTRESFTDGLGRLEEVIENPGGLGYVTSYGYDALDDLTSVVQNSSRNRTFVYDSLARLTSSTNPEANWSASNQTYVATTYSYDADGNLINKTEPAQNQQGTTTVTLTYCYDALNRMIAKAYTSQPCTSTGGRMATPLVSYVYDGAALPSAPAGCTLGSFSYGLAIGRRTAMCEGTGEVEGWSYTITSGQGWKTTDQRTTNSLTKTATYQYNFLGSPTSITYPSGRVITYAYNLGDRPTSATDQTTLVNYANTAHYWAGGSPCWAVYGAAITAAQTYNPRLQPLNMQATSSVIAYPGSCSGLGQTGNLLDLSYNFNLGSGDNGNVMGITNNRDTTRSQNFGYDALNRLLTAETASTYSTSPSHCWGEAYVFDNNTTSAGAWGNLTNINVATTAYDGCTQETLSVTATAQNQVSAGTYDTAGNMTYISGAGGGTFSFNAENQMTQAATSSTTGYVYDGDGKRVEKTAGGAPYKLYWYGVDGSALDETDQTGSVSNTGFSEYVFLGGQRIGRRDYSNNVYYYASDHIGTSRVMAEVPSGSTTATLCYDADFYPFGGERAYTNTCTQNYKFTGKERDSESNLDNFGARYNSSNVGRFMSPDPIFYQASMANDPQMFNLYSYARNNPSGLVDPTGESIQLTCQGGTSEADCESARQAELDALKQAVGPEAAPYLYENAVTTTDANGNTATNYYVGIYTNGPNGSGPSFGDINSVSNAVAGIVNDPRVADLEVVPNGTTIRDDQGNTQKIGPLDFHAGTVPGATYTDQNGGIHIALLDPRTNPGSLPASVMSNHEPGFIDNGIIAAHELGNVRYLWGSGFFHFFDGADNSAIRLENNARKVRDPNAPIRTAHNPPDWDSPF